MNEMKRCDNLACVCDVPAAQETCGDYCKTVERDPDAIRCECGHASCADTMNKELSGNPLVGRE